MTVLWHTQYVMHEQSIGKVPEMNDDSQPGILDKLSIIVNIDWKFQTTFRCFECDLDYVI